MSPYRDPDTGLLTQKGKDRVKTGLFRAAVLALGGVGTCGVWLLKANMATYAQSYIASAPAVVDARTTAAAAKDAATLLGTKVDALIQTEAHVFDSMKQSHADQQTTLLAVTGIGQHLADLESQVNRIETKQDATPR